MGEQEFISGAENMLSSLLQHAEDMDFDAELQSGVLTITLSSGKQYVINRHNPTKQIWVSSPVSGASYFAFQDGNWVMVKGGNKGAELKEMIARELSSS